MTNKFGKVTKEADGFKVHFERILNHDIETVWEAITNPDKLKKWFTDFEMEFKPGGKLTIWFKDEARTATYGKVIEIDRPHRFVFTWEDELAVWELFKEKEGKCKLTLTYSKLSDQFAASVPAGFHTLLEQLEAVLNGDPGPYPFGTEEGTDPEQLRLKEIYKETICKEYPELVRYQPIIVEKTYNANVERVWKAITDKDQMKQWYFDLDAFKPEVGFEFQFKGKGHKGEEYNHLCKITEVIPGKKLTYSWAYEGHEGTSYVTFELFANGEKTTLKLTHTGLHTFPRNNPDFARESFNGGWNELIGNLLKQFLEKDDIQFNK